MSFQAGIGSVGGAYGPTAGFALPTIGHPRNLFGQPAGEGFARYLAGFGVDDDGGAAYLRDFGQDPMARFQQQAWEELSKDVGTPAPGAPGSMASPGGEWSGVDQWDSAIAAATAKHGVPPNLIKAVMQIESGGDPGATGASGVVGLMQINQDVWGVGPWSTDNAANIDKGAEILRYYYDANGGDWYQALRGYHGYGWDGNTTDAEYADIVMGNWTDLNAWGGAGGGGAGGGGISAMFPNGSVPDWGGFNLPSSNGLYGYGTEYGLNGINHTGLDVPMPLNSAMYAPMGGVVTCAGTGVGSGADDRGCGAFNDYIGGGAGRIELHLDNGAVLIFGHSSRANVRPGQRVTPGDLIGWSGGMYGEHIHLEARVRDAGTRSGWRIVDPRSVLGGAVTGPGPGGGRPAATPAPVGMWWQQPVDVILNHPPAWGGA